MLSMTSPSRWQNLGLVLLLLGLFGWESDSSGQSVFDPYQPYSSDYTSSSYPSLPNNLALPGQAREAREYQSYNNVRGSGGTFDRFVNGDDSDFGSFGSERRGGIGVPYYDVARRTDRTIRRESSAVSETDRAFIAFEAEKNRLYQIAIKERDPAQRAKLLREVARMQPPQSTFSRGTESRKTTAKRADVSRRSASEALAAEALAGAKPIDAAPREVDNSSITSGVRRRSAAGRTLDVRSLNTRRPRELPSATRRPPLPSETGESGGPQSPR